METSSQSTPWLRTSAPSSSSFDLPPQSTSVRTSAAQLVCSSAWTTLANSDDGSSSTHPSPSWSVGKRTSSGIQNEEPTPSGELTYISPHQISSHFRSPPTAMKDAAAVPDPSTFFSARFLDNMQNASSVSARTAVHLAAPAGQTFVPLNITDFRYSVSTPMTLSRKRFFKDSKNSTTLDETESSNESGPAKRLRPACAGEAARRKTIPTRPAKLELRTNKPLKNAEEIHMDVWRIILKNSPLRFLLSAKTINRRFYDLLKTESTIWYESRVNQYGEMPGPPGGMTEQQYAQLLEGKGCQNINCAKTNTGKIYWAFRIRLCESCLLQRTLREEAAERYRFYDSSKLDLLSLLPAAVVDSGKYLRARQIDPKTGDWEHTSAGPMFLISDIDAIEAEYDRLVEDGRSGVEITEWRAQKRARTEGLAAEIAAIERFVKIYARCAIRHRRDRAGFFRDQAAKLSPPMSQEVLNKMLAYKMSLDANTAVTERMWEALKIKILPYRAEAERLVDIDQQMEVQMGSCHFSSPQFDSFIALRNRRSPGRLQIPKKFVPEQEFVLELGRKQLLSCQKLEVGDSDLVLRVLKGIYQSFQAASPKAVGMNADNSFGLYRLTLDDARLILHEIIEPEVKSWHDSRRASAALEQFKCVGCPRRDCLTKYSFVKGFEHIFNTHAQYVGEEHQFSILAAPFPKYHGPDNFPWYTVYWPRNLPLVAAHHTVRREDKWKPDEDMPYTEAKKAINTSAFAGRKAFDHPSIPASDFQSSIVFAAEKLRPTALGGDSQTRIALQFSLDRYASIRGTQKPELKGFTNCFKKIQEVNSKFDFRYRCGPCSRQINVPRTTKFIKSPVPFHELEEHFVKKHARLDWTTDMMDLPSDTELLEQIINEDAALREKKDVIQAREQARRSKAKKRPSPKSAVVLNTQAAMDVFDVLYPRS